MLSTLIYFTIYALSLLHAKPLTNYHPTNILPVTTPQGCEYEGELFSPGESFNQGADDKGGCYGLYCSYDGNVIPWDNFDCGSSTTHSLPSTNQPLPKTTPFPPTTPPITITPKTTIKHNTIPKSTTPQASIPFTTFPPYTQPSGCEYEGKFYAPGEQISEDSDGEGWCFGLYCSYHGDLVPWDNFNCETTASTSEATTFPPTETSPRTTIPPSTTQKSTATSTTIQTSITQLTTTPHTTTPQTTIPDTTIPSYTQPLGCEYEGKFYAPGEQISEDSDGEGWCFGLYCSYDGNLVPWDNFNCETTASTSEATTFPPTETSPRTTIPPSTTQKSTTTSTTIQTSITQLTTTPHTTTPQTTIPDTTIPSYTQPSGCEYEGKFYAPGEQISEDSDGEGWCFGLYCSYDSNLVPWDNFNCGATTTSLPTTIPPPPITTTIPPPPITTPDTPTTTGCMYEGKVYPPGEISRGTDGRNWCYGLICDPDGQLIAWDDWSCGSTTPVLSTVNPTPPITTMPTTTPSPPTTISITTAPTTTPSPPTTIFKTKSSPTKSSMQTTHNKQVTISETNTLATLSNSTRPPIVHCFHEGRYYENGEIISRFVHAYRWCSGWYCNEGKTESWNDFNCASPTTFPTDMKRLQKSTSSTPGSGLQCYHRGIIYNDGDVIGYYEGSGGCDSFYCTDGVLVPYDAADCGSAIQTTLPTAEPHLTTTKTNPPTRESNPPTKRAKPRTTKANPPTTKTNPSTRKANLPTTKPHLPSTKTRILATKTDLPTTEVNPPTTKFNLHTIKTHQPITGTNQPKTESRPTTQSRASAESPDPMLCFHEGKYYAEGDIISRDFDGSKWCSGWYCKGGRLIPLDCGGITDAISKEKPSSPKPETVLPPTTLGPEPSRCFHEGRYYEEGDLASNDFDGDDWCPGLLCKGGEMVLDNCGTETITLATAPSTKASQNSDTTQVPKSTAESSERTGQSRKSTTKVPKSTPITKLSSKDTTKSSGILNSGTTKITPYTFTKTHTLATNTGPPTTEANPPTTKFNLHTKSHLPTTETNQPKTETSKPVHSTLAQSTTPSSISHPTTQRRTSTKIPDPMLCFHEGKYYAEGDIISRDFDGSKWCSGWYCKDGRLILLDCGGITDAISKEKPSSPKPQTVLPPTTLGPEPSRCFHEGRYYEEGDLASNDFDSDDWCPGLLCKGGEMVLDNCGTERITPETTPSTQLSQTSDTTQVPKSTVKSSETTGKDLKSTSKVPKRTTKTTLITKLFSKDTTKISGIMNPDTTKITPYTSTKSPDITTISPESTRGSLDNDTKIITKVPHFTTKLVDSTTSEPDTTRKLPDTTTRSPDITTRTHETTTITSDETTRKQPNTTRKPQKTTPTQPEQTTKPEKLRCYYKGLLYPPGEVTRGFLSDGRCYGVICDISGVIIQWVSATCTPTEPPTAEIKATLPGCVYRDKYYPPGRISRMSDGSNWCLDVICTEEGKITSLNNWDCSQATTTATPTTATTATSIPEGNTCLYNGMRYPPGIIKEGIDKNGWCYKVFCQDDGQLYLWGDWNCKLTFKSPTTIPPEVTTPPTVKICSYNGKDYPVGVIIRGEDATGWCYGVICREDGQVMLWGSFKCGIELH